jgi:hypothetical protein
MKTKLVTVVSTVTMSWLALMLTDLAVAQRGENYRPPSTSTTTSTSQASQQQGAGGAIVATQIAPQEAAKKYPAPNGRYPTGERDPHKSSGLVNSPYPPHTEFDCSKVPHGALVLDTRANKVFMRP